MFRNTFFVITAFLVWHWINGVSVGQTTLKNDAEGLNEEKLELIKLEISTLDESSWEGEYLCFPGVDEAYQLLLSKKYGFVFRRIGNAGYSSVIFGTINEASGEVTLKSELNKVLPGALSSKLLVAHGVKRIFVIPKERIHGFCLDFKSSSIDAVKGYFSKPDPNSSRKNDLAISNKFLVYLKLPEIIGEIIEIQKPKTNDSSVPLAMKFNRGKKNHLFKGMRFAFKWKDDERGEVQSECEVKELQDETSLVVVVGIDQNRQSASIGTKVSTSRFPWSDL